MNANGNDQLPEHRQKLWEAGNAAYQAVLTERDDFERKLHNANLEIEAKTVQLESLKGVVNMMESAYLSTKLEMESRVLQYQQERDSAVRENARLEAALTNCYVVLQRHIKGQD